MQLNMQLLDQTKRVVKSPRGHSQSHSMSSTTSSSSSKRNKEKHSHRGPHLQPGVMGMIAGVNNSNNLLPTPLPSSPEWQQIRRQDKILLEFIDLEVRQNIRGTIPAAPSGFHSSPSSPPAGRANGGGGGGGGGGEETSKLKPLGLLDVFVDFHGVFDYFCDFMATSLAFENMSFLLEVARLRKITREHIKALYTRYFSANSIQELNVTQEIRGAVEKQMKQTTIDSFLPAIQNIIYLLNNGSFPSFLKSKQYNNWMELQKSLAAEKEANQPIWKKMVDLVSQNAAFEAIKTCLEEGGSANDADNRGQTCLHIAANLQSTNLASFLFEHGADPNLFDQSSWTPLHVAATLGNLAMCNLLLENGACTWFENDEGELPLHYLVKHSLIGTASSPLTVSAEREKLFFTKGRGVLTIPAIPSVQVQILKEKDFSEIPQVVALEESSLLHTVISRLCKGQLIIRRNEMPTAQSLANSKTKRDETPLHYCLKSNVPHEGLLHFLLEKGAYVDVPNKREVTPLLSAITNGAGFSILRLLLQSTSVSNPAHLLPAGPFTVLVPTDASSLPPSLSASGSPTLSSSSSIQSAPIEVNLSRKFLSSVLNVAKRHNPNSYGVEVLNTILDDPAFDSVIKIDDLGSSPLILLTPPPGLLGMIPSPPSPSSRTPSPSSVSPNNFQQELGYLKDPTFQPLDP